MNDGPATSAGFTHHPVIACIIPKARSNCMSPPKSASETHPWNAYKVDRWAAGGLPAGEKLWFTLSL
jgi:hypothetical protein